MQDDILRYSIGDTFISTLGDSLRLIAQLEDGSDLPEYITFDAENEEFIIDGAKARELGIEEVTVRVVAVDSEGNTSSDSFLIEFEPNEDGSVDATVDGEEVPGIAMITGDVLSDEQLEAEFAAFLSAMTADEAVTEDGEVAEEAGKESLSSQIARAGEFGYQQDKMELNRILEKLFGA